MKPLKTLLFIIALFVCRTIFAQGNAVQFTYDNGGNMVQRNIVIQFRFMGPHGNDTTKTSSNYFKVYPNQASQFINIEGELPQKSTNATLQIMNTLGEIVKSDIYDGSLKSIDVSQLTNGIYFLEIIYSKKEKSTYKIIISN